VRGADSGRLESGCGTMEGGWRSGGRLCWRATCQGIANWKLIERLRAEAGSGSLRPTVLPAFDRFPHASKNSHVATGFVRILWFGSDALQAAPGWQSANHGSI
jgi:hypothetical protein